MMSSGTRREWTPGKYPQDSVAAQRLREWLAGEGGDLNLIELDLIGADLSGGEYSNAWFTEAALTGVNFAEAEFYRSNLQDADLTRANLTRVSLVRVDLDWALLRDATLDGANVVTTSLFEVDAAGSRWRGAQFANSPFLDVNLCGADLTGAVFDENALKARVDDSTVFRDITGSIFGPMEAVQDDVVHTLAGNELESWLRARGADVRVLDPKGP